ncbi:META domain-containing protein [Thiofilum flexile]|uniref:META domain-containing protein n=1 Tax=Thiofilum flexile TaxID=125627 RepID=UPI00047612B8|nr:META domain-containing protein [Thiofilum flexile]
MNSPLTFSSLKYVGILNLAAFYLVACGSVSSTPTSTTLPSLAGETALLTLTKAPWKLVTIQEGSALPSARLKAGIPANHIRLMLGKNQLALTGGCNRLGGEVLLGTDGSFKVPDLSTSTEMACEAERMQADMEMSQYLTKMAFYEVTQKRLKLQGDNKTLSFVTASLSK